MTAGGFVHSNCLNPEPPYPRGLIESKTGGFNPLVKCSSKSSLTTHSLRAGLLLQGGLMLL